MKIGNTEINRNNIQLFLIIGLIGVVTYLIIFDKDDGKELRKQSEQRVEELENEINEIRRNQQIAMDSIYYYQQKQKEWDRTDSLRRIELENIEKEKNRYLAEKNKAEQEREEALQKLEDFKENPPKIDDPIFLIKDTKNRLN
jgi:flagellar biosynthesis GTPase FlhF